MKKILIMGANGQLGDALINYYSHFNDKNIIIATDLEEINITNLDEVTRKVKEINPDIIINCAAYTNVEKCETEYDKAYEINAIGARNIAQVAKEMDIVFVHISTDYVFDGTKKGAYIEEDMPNPSSAYGKTKYAGEKFVEEIGGKYFIVRTAWLFGNGNNFVNTMLKLSQEREVVQVVTDQIGSPTSAAEVAKVIARLVESDNYGVYHATCEGECSWDQFAKEIFSLLNFKTVVKSVTSSEYPSIVDRPKNSVLSNINLKNKFNYEMSTWENAIREYLSERRLLEERNMIRRVLVTGANGYVGRHVVKSLLDMGYEVIASDFNFDGVDKRAKQTNVPIFCKDKNIYALLGKPDVCIHLAWRNGFVHNDDTHISDIYDHYTFIKNMVDGGLPHVSIMGTMHEVGYWEGPIDEATPTNPTSLYGIAKNALRQMVQSLIIGKGTTLQWLRAYYIMGDDLKNNSIFSKLVTAEIEGQAEFPLNSGKNRYDFIMVEELSLQIAKVSVQQEVVGIINCCTGNPVSLGEKVEEFIAINHYNIKLKYGAFPDRAYDSPEIWGDATKINKILEK